MFIISPRFPVSYVHSPQVRNKPMPAKREADTELSVASRELDRYQSMSVSVLSLPTL